ncbi:MAG: ribonuclease HI family protein [Chloroflexi bacterium]|nr:ribonuclease HI family protein [Chloroflexota bacterium]
MPGKSLIVYTDGAAQPNPGPAAIGVVILDASGHIVDKIQRYIGHATNNQAEYQALVAGLARARELGAEQVEVRSDSELLVRQLQGSYRVRKAELKPLFERSLQLARQFTRFCCVHIPRHQNLADAPSKQGLKQR